MGGTCTMSKTKDCKKVQSNENSALEEAANEAAKEGKTYGQWQAAQLIELTKINRKWY